ncbi:MAG: iron export ABC transporter permease subunit FetB [Rhodospirillaceae bacterium]
MTAAETTAQVVSLAPADLAIAALLLAVNGALSLKLKLGVTRSLAIAATRMIVQLTILGMVLRYLFAIKSLWLTLGVVAIMIGFAGYEVMSRQDRKLKGLWSYGIGVSTMTFAAVTVTLLALATQIKPDPWYDPRYAVPILGMMLGNAMTGISLGLNNLFNAVTRERWAVEAQIALGETRDVALKPFIRRALKTALMPTINSMAATGIVSLPGMMTGQILAGADPAEAVKYQLLVMFLICGATCIGAVTAIYGAVFRLTDPRHRLRLDRIAEAEKS